MASDGLGRSWELGAGKSVQVSYISDRDPMTHDHCCQGILAGS